MRHRYGIGVAVVSAGWLFLGLFHRSPGVLLFDYAWIAYNLLPLPLSRSGIVEAIRWQATVHSPSVARPARAVLWWLGTALFGCDPLGYYVVNALTLGAAVWAIWQLAATLTGSASRAIIVALCVAVTYATVFPLLFFGYAQPALFAYLGLGAWFHVEASQSARRWPLRSAAVGLVVLAVLMHETYLAYTLVPLFYALVVLRDRSAAARAAIFLAILPVYAVSRALLTAAGSPSLFSVVLSTARDSPGTLVENTGRVAFGILTGGLPLDPLRALPWLPEFGRMREIMLRPVGIATMALVLVPAVGLVTLALTGRPPDPMARRRIIFYLLWLAAGSLPLMLPVGTSEAVHLVGALPAVFLLWSEAFGSKTGRAALAAAWLLLGAWTTAQLGARWILFHRDVPAMSRAVKALHRVFLDAQRSGMRAAVVFQPIQIGGHYGMLPTLPALYPDATGGCVRGDRAAGCLVEPVWIWSTLRPAPILPPACRTADRLRIGPIDAAAERELEGSARMLSHSTVSLTKDVPPTLVGMCSLQARDEIRHDGARYRIYRLDAAPDVRWYRFTLDGARVLEPVERCAAEP